MRRQANYAQHAVELTKVLHEDEGLAKAVSEFVLATRIISNKRLAYLEAAGLSPDEKVRCLTELVDVYEQRVKQFRVMVDAVSSTGRPLWGLYRECMCRATNSEVTEGERRDLSAAEWMAKVQAEFEAKAAEKAKSDAKQKPNPGKASTASGPACGKCGSRDHLRKDCLEAGKGGGGGGHHASGPRGGGYHRDGGSRGYGGGGGYHRGGGGGGAYFHGGGGGHYRGYGDERRPGYYHDGRHAGAGRG